MLGLDVARARGWEGETFQTVKIYSRNGPSFDGLVCKTSYLVAIGMHAPSCAEVPALHILRFEKVR